VVMLEFTKQHDGAVIFERPAARGENIVARGSEAKGGDVLLTPGTRLGYSELALAAQVGRTPISLYARPRLAILSTGDEVVAHDQTPGTFQIRNSNSLSLALLAEISGADAVILDNAPDERAALGEAIEHGLAEDALVLSGGVSMGKYDLVEEVLAGLGAEFFFDAIAIRPGRPAVFGYCRGTPFFGLPGNPISTMVTFELLVQPALDILAGVEPRPLPFVGAKLARPTSQSPALAHFLPGRLSWEREEPVVEELAWRGSGDIVAFARANCLLYVSQERPEMAAGEWVGVLPRRGAF
jgi:molybdopterin molybdotransferase